MWQNSIVGKFCRILYNLNNFFAIHAIGLLCPEDIVIIKYSQRKFSGVLKNNEKHVLATR